MNRGAGAWFDGGAFVDDVLAYAQRHGMTRRQLIAAAELDLSSALQVLRGQREPSLLVACALAWVCDLTLDHYRLVGHRSEATG